LACGDERHDVEHCYSATADGNLSLSSLAFLEPAESDGKLLQAQRAGCALAGQSQQVIDIVSRKEKGTCKINEIIVKVNDCRRSS
jgi:hypothetical protein